MTITTSYSESMDKQVAVPTAGQRIASLDVYRGFVMVLMMGEIVSFSTVYHYFPESSFWQTLSFHQSHVEWSWLALHDMIQPSFSFLVGAAVPFSVAKRLSTYNSRSSLLKHAIVRSIILICLGIFLRSLHSSQTYFTFEDTLTQIGLGYTFLVVFGLGSKRNQIIAIIAILFIYWLAFALYPLPGSSLTPTDTGVPSDWPYNFHGFASHWNKNSNLAWAFDRWFLNLFPRENPFLFNGGGYATLSFIPTLATMMLGLVSGNILKSPIEPKARLKKFIILGICGILIGILLHLTGINPVVKRIWTPAWVILSGGLCFLFLSFFYWLVDIRQKKKWVFLLMFIGMNSIAAYVMADGGFALYVRNALSTHLRQGFDQIIGPEYATLINGGLVLIIEWLVLLWMYRKKIFIRI